MQDLIETFGRHFVSRQQVRALRELVQGEEGEHYAQLIRAHALLVATMPKTHETDDDGDNAQVQLHYFVGGANFYIIEKDAGSPDDEVPGAQHQAFGLADLYGDGGELGYISLPEIFESGAELDLYWQPKSLREIREKLAA